MMPPDSSLPTPPALPDVLASLSRVTGRSEALRVTLQAGLARAAVGSGAAYLRAGQAFQLAEVQPATARADWPEILQHESELKVQAVFPLVNGEPLGLLAFREAPGQALTPEQQADLRPLAFACGLACGREDPLHTDPLHTDPLHTDPLHTDPLHTDPLHTARLGRLVDASPIGIAVGDLQGNLIQVNDAYLRQLELTRADFEAGTVNWAHLTPPEYLPGDAAAFQRTFLHGHSGQYQKEMLSSRGERLPVSVNLVRYEQDDAQYVIGYVQDLRPHRTYEQTLRTHNSALERQVQERTALLAQHLRAQDAFVAFVEAAGTETDPLTLAQRAVEVLHGTLPQGSAVFCELEDGRWRARACSPDIPDEVIRQIREGLPEHLPDLIAARHTPEGLFNNGWAGDAGLDLARLYGAAALLPLQREPPTLLIVGTRRAHTWTDGERAIIRAIGRSLGLALERGTAAQHLRQRNAELDARTRALEGFAELTRDMDFRSNPHALIGRAQQMLLSLTPPGYADYFELKGGRWYSQVRTGDRRHAELQATVDAGLPHETLLTLRRPYETRQPMYQDHYDQGTDRLGHLAQQVKATASLPVLVNGKVQGVLALGLFGPHDWTATDRAVLGAVIRALELALEGAQGAMALRQRTQELERSNRELEQFAYVASHDLQEPLRTVTSFTQLLLKRLNVTDPRSERYAQFIMGGTDRMARLIQDLLAFSRVATQGRAPERVNTRRAVDQVLHDLGVQLEQAGAAVQVGTLPDVQADGTQLRQVFQNLLSNALKFTASGRPARVQISAERHPEHRHLIHFRVQDNGIGIAPEHFERIFTIFQRLHHRDDYEGSGIGLSIARRIVERHGGTIWLDSTPGQGTTFHFTLPEAR